MGYTTTISLHLSCEEAVPLVKEALSERGFGTLTEIDLRATMQAKLGEEIEPYVILGACNPSLAYRAITAERTVGALLPCNVVVRSVGGGGVVVEALDPTILVTLTENALLEPVASEAGRLIGEALAALSARWAP